MGPRESFRSRRAMQIAPIPAVQHAKSAQKAWPFVARTSDENRWTLHRATRRSSIWGSRGARSPRGEISMPNCQKRVCNSVNKNGTRAKLDQRCSPRDPARSLPHEIPRTRTRPFSKFAQKERAWLNQLRRQCGFGMTPTQTRGD